MKPLRPIHLILVVLTSCLVLGAMGCSEDEECGSDSTYCGTFTACCTSSDCYYLASDGTRFNCNGTDCTAAAEALANHMCYKFKDMSSDEVKQVVDEIMSSSGTSPRVQFR
ncbi:MAG: hypothetical protein IPK64_15265 [bacterium]|nr:hypothetical protein [bacterium]